jgi:hypothetical protein
MSAVHGKSFAGRSEEEGRGVAPWRRVVVCWAGDALVRRVKKKKKRRFSSKETREGRGKGSGEKRKRKKKSSRKRWNWRVYIERRLAE